MNNIQDVERKDVFTTEANFQVNHNEKKGFPNIKQNFNIIFKTLQMSFEYSTF